MMQWEQLLSLKKHGDTSKRLRKEQDETRLGFEVDYDRIIFSSAFRSLQDKTQVIPLSKTDFVHTRLTHSLEVSVVARSLGRKIGQQLLKKYPQLSATHGYHYHDFGAIVAAAALAHDIGNPPFGHSGEKAIGEFFKSGNGQQFKSQLNPAQWQDLTHFEGNANGFKLLTENKEGAPGGLRISYATLGAFSKYPKESLPHRPTTKIADKKFGYFQEQASFFNEVASELGLLTTSTKGEEKRFARHPLAFLVEAADDICYTVIDFEDGINLGLIEEDKALEYLSKIIAQRINTEKYSQLKYTKDRMNYLRSLAIGSLIEEAVNVFLANEEAILKGEFHHALLDASKYKAQIEDIIKISIEKIYQSREVLEKEISGYKVISTLLSVFTKAMQNHKEGAESNLDRLVRKSFLNECDFENQTTYQSLLEICSLVASMTDGNALRVFKKLELGSM
jgi:dGTPase